MKKEISGYTQTYNLKNKHYPWKESINSLLGFCDEVVVLDGGSNDGTYEDLLESFKDNKNIKIYQIIRNWNEEGFSLFDGIQKAEARKFCTKDWCFQIDLDEIVHENYYQKIKDIANNCPENIELLSFPFVEFWGLKNKIRTDFFPIKNRMSRNNKNITHGIPKQHRAYKENGILYSLGSDGCDYIRPDTFEYVQSNSIFDINKFYQLQNIVSTFKNENHIKQYEEFYNNLINNVPTIFHYSWANIEKKIFSYKNFWQKHWNDLYNKNIEDTIENNMFFDKPWINVTDKEIKELSEKLENDMCGWIFHNKIDFSKPYPSIYFKGNHPQVMNDWINKNAR
jgi:hypothetical protein